MFHYIKVTPAPAKLAILPGAFNPPTRAHMAMAAAALDEVDEVLFALPRRFPHKEYAGASFETRLELLRAALAGHPRFSLAAVDGGLFIDIAREALRTYGAGTEIFLLCGRDAAERIAGWDYGSGADFASQLEEFQLMVAGRGGPYLAPAAIRHRVKSIAIPPEVAEISSSELRRRIRSGEGWRGLAPASIVPLIEARRELW